MAYGAKDEEGPVRGLSPEAARLVEQGDLDGLTVLVEELAKEHAWDALDGLREHCRLALARGKQLWAVSAYAEYRLCLDGPGAWAARTLERASGRFALGPLPEVAASSHGWEELAPFLQRTPQAAMAAHERVVRGEDLTKDPVALELPPVLDLPLRLMDWEPRYALAEYGPDKVEAPPPVLPRLHRLGQARQSQNGHRTGGAGPDQPSLADRDVVSALEDLVAAWATESNGRAEAVCVTGPAADAVRALGAQPVEMATLAPETAFAAMGWAAASGGAHGRRRGTAPGRFGAWSVLGALADLPEGWAAQAEELGQVARATRWFAWGSGEPATGWALRLALEAPPIGGTSRSRAFALSAVDAY